MRIFICAIISVFLAGFNTPAAADDRLVRLAVPAALVETGLMGYMLPRFSLKTQVRVQVVTPGEVAEAALGADGVAVFSGPEQNWHLATLIPDHPGAERFAEWITSEVGQRAITGFAPGGTQLFDLPRAEEAVVEAVTFEGDAKKGRELSYQHCGRCHVTTTEDRMRGIGSTPSFFVLRAFEDWDYRFSAFFALKPHGAFTQIEDLTEPFPEDRPSPIVPVEITLDELDAILAYVSTIEPADLGAPLKTQ